MIKFCTRCKATKDTSAFYRRKSGRLRTNCIPCEVEERKLQRRRTPETTLETNRRNNNAFRAKNPAYQRDYLRLKKFGVTRERYDQMLREQGGGCAVCKSSTPQSPRVDSFAIDHDHATGQVRGLLCIPCNVAIGMLKDSPSRALGAAGYLGRRVEAGTSEGLLF